MAEAFKREFAPPTTNTDNNNTVNMSVLIQQLVQGLQDYDRNKTLVKALKYQLDDMQEAFEEMQSQNGLMRSVLSSLLISMENKKMITREDLIEAQGVFYGKLQVPKKIATHQIETFAKDIDFVFGDAPDEVMQFIMNNLNKEYEDKNDEDNN